MFHNELFDINGDGNLDLIMGGHEWEEDWYKNAADTVFWRTAIYLGNGDGTFDLENRILIPKIDGCWFWLPDTGCIYRGQIYQSSIFRTKSDILIGFCHDSRFTSDRIADNAKSVFGANHKGEKAIKIIKAALQGVSKG